MNLHKDKELFSNILRATSQYFGIKLEFIEKDYWITLVLYNLSKSKFTNSTVFKGGTSLSKGYNLINRFSEDIDLAIINENNKTGNEIKKLIRGIEKDITLDLNEIEQDISISKGSKYRKSVFEYFSIDKYSNNNKLVIEINSFDNPFPFQYISIKSFIYDYLLQTKYDFYINQFNIQPIEIQVLSKEQTLLEKLVSLIRNSYYSNYLISISSKIRHFYDLYYLVNDKDCIKFIESEMFKIKLNELLQHDKEIFDEPVNWQNKTVQESPLINDFDNIWKKIKNHYKSELTALSYTDVPNEKAVSVAFKDLCLRIK